MWINSVLENLKNDYSLKRMKLESILFLCFLKFAWANFLKNVTSEVFGDDVQYLPAAFGDFNSDKLTVSNLLITFLDCVWFRIIFLFHYRIFLSLLKIRRKYQSFWLNPRLFHLFYQVIPISWCQARQKRTKN